MNFCYQCPYFFNCTRYVMPDNNIPTIADPYTYPQNLKGALKLIQEAIAGEREDELTYQYLIRMAPAEEAKAIIGTIRDDEKKHNKMFRRIYHQLTGTMIPPSQDETFEKPTSYCDGIKKSLFGELNAVQKYRKILFALQDRVLINMLIEIITDELRHANLYNLLFTSARCFQKTNP